jgi:16S rRNA U516 pseudouridylate synthase RsuA-like enzyme
VYRVWVKAVLTDEMIAKVRKGMWIGDGMVKMLKIHSSKAGAGAPGAWYEIELMEGRNRVVRRIFETLRIEIRRTRSRWLRRGGAFWARAGRLQAADSRAGERVTYSCWTSV